MRRGLPTFLAALTATICAGLSAPVAAAPSTAVAVVIGAKHNAQGPQSDDFSTGSGVPGLTTSATLHNRWIGGLTWTNSKGSVGTTVALKGAATLPGLSGANNNGLFGYVSTDPANTIIVTRKLSLAAGEGCKAAADFLTANESADSWTAFNPTESGNSITNVDAYKAGYWNAATGNSVISSAGLPGQSVAFRPGDICQIRYTHITDGGPIGADYYVNGLQVNSGGATNVTTLLTAGTPLNFGFHALTTAEARLYDYFQIEKPDLQPFINIYAPNRIANLDPNGDLTEHLHGDYAWGNPPGAHYTLYDDTTAPGTPIAGFVNRPLRAFTASGGVWDGLLDTLPAASLPAAGVHVKVCRDDAIIRESCNWTPKQLGGDTILFEGQSLMVQAEKNTSTLAYTVNGVVWTTDGSTGASAGAVIQTAQLDSRVLPGSGASAGVHSLMPYFSNAYLAAESKTNINLLMCGIGGTSAAERYLPTSEAMKSCLIGLRMAGSNVRRGVNISGTFDAGDAPSGSLANYVSNVNAFYTPLEAIVGHPISVTFMLLGATTTGAATAANYDTIRRGEYNLSTTRVGGCLGVGTSHLAHNSGDQYHLKTWAYQEEMRMAGLAVAHCDEGAGTASKRGLYLNSVTATDDHTLAVVVDAPNAASVLVFQSSDATFGKDLGFNFGAITGGGSITHTLGSIHATSSSCGSVSSSQATCTFGFGSAYFASDKGMVTGPRGPNPFNPANDTTINDSGSANSDYWADLEGILMAVYTSGGSISGTVSSNVLTGTVTGTLHVGDWLKDPTNTRSYLITSFGTGTGANGNTGTYNLLAAPNQASTTVFTAAEPMQPIQHYFNPAGATSGVDDYVKTP